MKTLQPPVLRKDHSCAKEVWVLVSELAGDVLVGLQSPGYIVGAAIQLVKLSNKQNRS